MLQTIQTAFEEHLTIFKDLQSALPTILSVAQAMIHCLKVGGTLFLFGNGGSAADAQHIAAELMGRFSRERKAIAAVALSTDVSVLTALSNDYSYDIIFERQLEALLKPHDAVLAISTSGNSPNVIKGSLFAKQKQVLTIGLTGLDGGRLKSHVDQCITVPSNNTARIQEMHIFVGHLIAELVEKYFFESQMTAADKQEEVV